MPIVNQCCCGCTLRTGSRAIAIIGIIFHSLNVLLFIISLSQISAFKEMCTNDSVNMNKECRDEIDNKVYPGLVVALVAEILLLVVVSLMLYGINKGRRGFMLPWIIIQIITAVAIAIILIIAMAVIGGGAVIGFAVLYLTLLFALPVYFIIVVFSHYQELGNPSPNYVN